MLQRIFNLFSSKEKKLAFERLQYLDKRIPLITLEKEKYLFEKEKEKIRNKIYSGVPIKEVNASIDDLSSTMERYIRIQEDDDYVRIIQHLAFKNIKNETDIEEICDIIDRNIVFKYFQSGEHIVLAKMRENLKNELENINQIIQTLENIISNKEDIEELRFVWGNIINKEKDKFNHIKNKIENLENNEKRAIDALNYEISNLSKKFICLEKYAKEYLSEQSLELFTSEVKDFMPQRGDITYEYILNGMADCIITELNACFNGDNVGEPIKDRMAKLIYGRLKKGMFVI